PVLLVVAAEVAGVDGVHERAPDDVAVGVGAAAFDLGRRDDEEEGRGDEDDGGDDEEEHADLRRRAARHDVVEVGAKLLFERELLHERQLTVKSPLPMHWNVTDYERFRNERARPFFDLVDRLPPGPYHSIIDLGCGTGELTRALAERYSGSVVLGVD